MISTKKTSWPSIIFGDAADETHAAIGDIARALKQPPPAWIPATTAEPFRRARGASLAQGRAGIALFFAYLQQSGLEIPSVDPEKETERYVEEACRELAEVPMSASFMHGFTGILWTVQHLNQLISPADAGPLAMADELLGYDLARDGFDLWRGIVGHGVLALEGLPDPTAALLVADLVGRLETNAMHDADGTYWISLPTYLKPAQRRSHPRPYHNLGAAHGQACVIAFLARVHASGIATDLTLRLVEGAVRRLLKQVVQDSNGNFVPATLEPAGEPVMSMETWCNGTPGVAISLLVAAACCKRPDWREAAIALARDAALRSLARHGKGDASLCHGTAGEALLWHRFHAATNESVFAEAARKWYRQTLSMKRPGIGVGGYVSLGLDNQGEVVELHEPGLLQGAAGVGLALLAGLGGQAPNWDRLLQLSTAEPRRKNRHETN